MFGEHLFAWRRFRKLSQTDLAARTGLRQAYISRIEKGEIEEPRLGVRRALAKGLKIDVKVLEDTFPVPEELFGGDNPITVITTDEPLLPQSRQVKERAFSDLEALWFGGDLDTDEVLDRLALWRRLKQEEEAKQKRRGEPDES